MLRNLHRFQHYLFQYSNIYLGVSLEIVTNFDSNVKLIYAN